MMLWKRKHYMEWNEYRTLVREVDDLLWRQAVRKASLANL